MKYLFATGLIVLFACGCSALVSSVDGPPLQPQNDHGQVVHLSTSPPLTSFKKADASSTIDAGEQSSPPTDLSVIGTYPEEVLEDASTSSTCTDSKCVPKHKNKNPKHCHGCEETCGSPPHKHSHKKTK